MLVFLLTWLLCGCSGHKTNDTMQESSREEHHNLQDAVEARYRDLTRLIDFQSHKLPGAGHPMKSLTVLLMACNPTTGYRAGYGASTAGPAYRSVTVSSSPCRAGTHSAVLMRQNSSLDEEASPLELSASLPEGGENLEMEEEQIDSENKLDLQTVVETLTSDIPQILRKEPNWDIFASDFHVNSSREGFGVFYLLSGFLKSRSQIFLLEEDVQVNFVDGRDFEEPFDPFFVARWKLVLERPFNPLESVIRYLSFWRQNDPITIQAETVFKFNKRNEVDSVQINKLVVDGRKTMSWPAVSVQKDPSEFLAKIQNFVQHVELDPLQKLREWAEDLKDLDHSVTPIINTWKSLAAKSKATAETEIACDDTRAKIVKKLAGTQRILTQMADDIEWSSPDEILALVRKADSIATDLSMNIFAMATASQQAIFDSSGKLETIAENLGLKQAGMDFYEDGRVPIVEIGEVVAMPSRCAGSMRGLGEELLIRIVRRGAALGRLVVIAPANEFLEKYYGKMGFERIDELGLAMVYSKPLPEATKNELMYEMASLRVS
mmetsp:Transcript_133338/g.242979  ORF Transcript_133338/g.242979 Transcript_133338/m.242979 type:complete len:549 (+) Transcript_133338:112-1758(+)